MGIAYFIAGIAILIALMLISRWYVSASPKTLKKGLIWIGFTLVVILVMWLAVTGKLWAAAAALPAIFVWFMRIFTGLRFAQMFSRMAGLGGGAGPGWRAPGDDDPGQTSRVQTRFVIVYLNHETGHVWGEVLDGTHRGRPLESLEMEEVMQVYREAQSDPDSVRVIEGYLDRRDPSWRANTQSGGYAGGRSEQGGQTADPGSMTHEDAYRVLGLKPGASKAEIKAAHRRLMAQVHPDKGGSDFLAQQINAAKDLLLGK